MRIISRYLEGSYIGGEDAKLNSEDFIKNPYRCIGSVIDNLILLAFHIFTYKMATLYFILKSDTSLEKELIYFRLTLIM